MAQYIDKSALVAEVMNRIKELQNLHKENEEKLDSIQKISILLCIDECKVILSFLDTLEVKEVDLEKEYEEFVVDDPIFGNFITNDTMGMKLAKHFFELGLRVNGYHQAEKDNELTWEDMRELYIIFAEVNVEIKLCKTDIQAETIGYYQEVLKRFKAYKGEEV